MNILQLKASNPQISTWVSASAGTGKTKILTDRVLRLLLEDVPFNKILCLTFTNAGASEMQERIIASLEKWSKLSESELQLNLKNLLGREASKEEINKASKLFDLYLKSPDQINIYTIHSFCQKILKIFPLEAGLAPNFKIIDEIKVHQIIKKIKNHIFNLPNIQPINRFLAENFHELTINEIFNEVISLKAKILEKRLEDSNDLLAHGPDIIKKLSTPEVSNYLDIIENEIIRELVLPRHCEEPQATWQSQEAGEIYVASPGIATSPAAPRNDGLSSTNSLIKSFFLTSDGAKRKRIVTKKIASPDSPLYRELEHIQDKIYKLDQQEKAEHLALHSKLLELIAKKIIDEFEIYKKKNALLDYDDLIIYTQNLLTNSDVKQWVLYKLDGFVDHLMVDEAQDTSKNQWRIIEALIEEFYSGESNNTQNRTIFVVGDEKQSIFSFQGADLSSFFYMNQFLHEKLSEAKKPFETINLEISYRSTKEILTLVSDIFNKIAKNNPDDFQGNIQEMTAHRADHSGMVELWPLCITTNHHCEELHSESISGDNTSSLLGLPRPLHGLAMTPDNTQSLLAEKIANYIKQQLTSDRILPSTGKRISAEDFMILVRTRDDFTKELIKSLNMADIETTGLDRINLIEDLAVADLLSIAKFVLNPDNDLNLACLLKSPIFGLSEEELYDLIQAKNKEKKSIWEWLRRGASPMKRHPTGAASDNNRHSGSEAVRNLSRPEVMSVLSPEISLRGTRTSFASGMTILQNFISLYKNLPLTDFFLYITDVFGYRTLISKNDDTIDEFLKLSRNYFHDYGASLQNFIYWFEENEISIKRDTNAKNKLRIMTTHGAKGLQAPIVILCDTTKLPITTDRFLWNGDNEMLSPKSSSYVPEFYEILKENQKQKTYQEYLRLLYVGLTRAEDHLVICGYQGSKQIPENCWYNWVKKSMIELGTLREDGALVYGEEETSLRGAPATWQSKEGRRNRHCEEPRSETKQSQEGRRALLPHEIAAPITWARNDVSSPRNNNTLQYGTVFHKILEDSVGSKQLDEIHNHPLILTLNDKEQSRIKLSLEKLISNQEFIDLLKCDLKTEVSFGYKAGSEVKIGRIDLLVLRENEMIIIDYKSDSKPASDINLIPENYITQLNFYKEAFKEIYPLKQINCKILWLENGEMVDVI